MALGITVLLIVAVGVGYFLYQKFYSRNRNVNRERSHNTNVGEYRSSPNYQQPTGQAYRVQNVGTTPNRPLVPASRNNITETGPMIYFANDRHGRSDKVYRFNYKKVGGGWRAYILRTPHLGGRSSDSATIHRLHDNDGYYVCWDRPVNTLKDMQIISRRWADSIQEYISTGRFG